MSSGQTFGVTLLPLIPARVVTLPFLPFITRALVQVLVIVIGPAMPSQPHIFAMLETTSQCKHYAYNGPRVIFFKVAFEHPEFPARIVYSHPVNHMVCWEMESVPTLNRQVLSGQSVVLHSPNF